MAEAARVRRRPWWGAVLAVACSPLLGCAGAPSSAGPVTSVAPVSTTQPAPPWGARLAGTGLQPITTTPTAIPSWAPWPAALHDFRHSGASIVDGPTVGVPLWRRSLEGPVTPGPVVAPDGTIYAASNAGILHALDPATGADRWTFDSGQRVSDNDLSTSPLVLADGTILWGASGDRLIALSPAGTVVWTQPLGGAATSPTTADGHRVYVGDTSGGLAALDVSDARHQLVWTLRVGDSSFGSVVTDGAGRLYTTANSALIAVDDHGRSADIAWRADPNDGISEVSAGLAPDGTALLGTNGGREWAYRPDGTLRWAVPRVITYSSPAVTADGLIYLADHSGQVQVLRQADGSRAADYRLDPPSQIWSSVAVDRAHRLYFGTQQGRVLGTSPDGRVMFNIDLAAPIDCYPALTSDHRLIIGARNGQLVAIG